MASKVLKDGTVLAYNSQSEQIEVRHRASIWILNGSIEAIVDNIEDLSLPSGTDVLDVKGKIVSPGFVNTHIHSWQTVYRTCGPNINLLHYMPWFSQRGYAASQFSAQDIYYSTLECYLEGLNAGVTSYVDHAHNNVSRIHVRPGYEACDASGARIWWCYDPSPSEDFPIEEHWQELQDISANRDNASLVTQGFAADTLCFGSDDGLAEVKDMMKKLDVQHITVHHLGGPWPTPKSAPAQFSEAYAFHELNIPVTYSHAGFLTEDDMAALRKHDTHISITPESEFHYGQGQATGHLIGDQASIGVDTQFTFSSDMLTQMRMWLQGERNAAYRKCLDQGLIPRDNPVAVVDAFLLGTRQGGKALHRDDIGVLKVGAKADIVVFNGDSPNMLGWHDPIAAIVLHANVGDVQHVLVNGEFRKRDFELVCKKHDWATVKKEFLESCERIQPHALQPPPMPDSFFGQGTVGDVETFSLKKR